MNENFKNEIELINMVYDRLITTTNDEVAFNLYKKCSEVYNKYQDTTDPDNFRNLGNTTNNIINFRAYIQEYYPTQTYSNAKENGKVKELSNGHAVVLDKENVA